MPDLPLLICYSAIVLEMLIVNLVTIDKACARKASKAGMLVQYAVWTVIIFAVGISLLSFIPLANGAKALFVLAGFLYMIPMRFIYKNHASWLFEVICTALSYTLWTYALSVNIAIFLPHKWFAWGVLVLQSILLAILTPWYMHFCKSIFLETLALMPDGVTRKLRFTSTLWFCVILISNYIFIEDMSVLNIVCMVFLGILCYMCYTLLHSSLLSRMRAEKFKEIAYVDDLTGLPNRAAFFQDGQKLLLMQHPFDLIFLDLDHFKQINDIYGHMQGNTYLQGFAASIKELCSGIGTAYRMSGDEFVCILKEGARQEFAVRLVKYRWPMYVKGQPFLGVAAGAARCPLDGDSLDALVQKADKAMYGQKGKR